MTKLGGAKFGHTVGPQVFEITAWTHYVTSSVSPFCYRWSGWQYRRRMETRLVWRPFRPERGVLANGRSLKIRQRYDINNTGANQNPKFWNSELVRMPIRYSDGQQPIFSDKFGQPQLPNHFFRKKVDCACIYFVVFFAYPFDKQNMKKSYIMLAIW